MIARTRMGSVLMIPRGPRSGGAVPRGTGDRAQGGAVPRGTGDRAQGVSKGESLYTLPPCKGISQTSPPLDLHVTLVDLRLRYN